MKRRISSPRKRGRPDSAGGQDGGVDRAATPGNPSGMMATPQELPLWIHDLRLKGESVFQVFLLGSRGVGKTSMAFQRAKGVVVQTEPTNEDEYHIIEESHGSRKNATSTLQIVDLCFERTNEVIDGNGDYPTGFIVCFSMGSMKSYMTAKRIIARINERKAGLHAIVLVASKCDLPKEELKVSSEKARLFSGRVGINFLRTTVSSHNCVIDVFSRINELLLKNLETYESLRAVAGNNGKSVSENVEGAENQPFLSCIMCNDRSRGYVTKQLPRAPGKTNFIRDTSRRVKLKVVDHDQEPKSKENDYKAGSKKEENSKSSGSGGDKYDRDSIVTPEGCALQ